MGGEQEVFKCSDLSRYIQASTHVLISTDIKGEQEGLTRKTRPQMPKEKEEDLTQTEGGGASTG